MWKSVGKGASKFSNPIKSIQQTAFSTAAQMINSANLQEDNYDASEMIKVKCLPSAHFLGFTLLPVPTGLALFPVLGTPPHEPSVHPLPCS
jgi:hypothetical protein